MTLKSIIFYHKKIKIYLKLKKKQIKNLLKIVAFIKNNYPPTIKTLIL